MKRLCLALLAACLLLTCSAVPASDNFILTAPGFTQEDANAFAAVMEKSRRDVALYWFGHALPAWSAREIVTATKTDHVHGGGATNFSIWPGGRNGTLDAFGRGEVGDFKCDVRGNRSDMLANILPHETTHSVIHSVLRRKLPRVLDEGMAGFSESEEMHARSRQQVRKQVDTKRFMKFADILDRMEYLEGRQMIEEYDQAFCLVEFLIDKEGPDQFIRFLADARAPSQKLEDYYGFANPTKLESAWWVWFQEHEKQGYSCEAFGCCAPHSGRLTHIDLGDQQLATKDIVVVARPLPKQTGTALPTLYVIGSSTCGPCKGFDKDYAANTNGLKTWLDNSFEVKVIHVDSGNADDARFAQAMGVRSYPSFRCSDHRMHVNGYSNAGNLMARLQKHRRVIRNKADPVPPPNDPGPVPEDPTGQTAPQPPPGTMPAPQPEPAPAPAPQPSAPGIVAADLSQLKTDLTGEFGKLLTEHEADLLKAVADGVANNQAGLAGIPAAIEKSIASQVPGILQEGVKDLATKDGIPTVEAIGESLLSKLTAHLPPLLATAVNGVLPGILSAIPSLGMVATGVGAPLGIAMLLGHFLLGRKIGALTTTVSAVASGSGTAPPTAAPVNQQSLVAAIAAEFQKAIAALVPSASPGDAGSVGTTGTGSTGGSSSSQPQTAPVTGAASSTAPAPAPAPVVNLITNPVPQINIPADSGLDTMVEALNREIKLNPSLAPYIQRAYQTYSSLRQGQSVTPQSPVIAS